MSGWEASGRSRRVVVVVSAVVVVAAVTGTAWYASVQAHTPAQQAASARPPATSVITDTVTAGPLVDGVEFDGRLVREFTRAVTGPATVPGAAKVVVTRAVRTGTEVTAGDVLAEVSGRPLVVLRGTFPSYRDLALGDTGPDVRQLQSGLRDIFGSPTVTGTYDTATARAVRRLYLRAGYATPTPASGTGPPGSAGVTPAANVPGGRVPLGEITFQGSLPAVVTSVDAAVGGPGDGRLVTVSSGRWQVRADVPSALEQDSGGWRPGTVAKVSGIGNLTAKLVGVQAPDAAAAPTPDPGAGPGEAQTGGGRPVAVFDIPDPTSGTARVGATVHVRIERTRSPADSVVVPVSALWTGADGTVSVLLLDGARQHRVPVTVLMSVDGRAALAAGTPLVVSGARVVVGYAEDTNPAGLTPSPAGIP